MYKRLIVGTMQTNCYIIYNETKCLIVDPGGNARKIKKFIEEKELTPVGILLTHGHFDHFKICDMLYNIYHCPIYTHEYSDELLNNPQLNLSYFEGEMVLKSPRQFVDGQFEVDGFHIEWFLMEGHCQGSSMIYLPDENILLSGDVLFAGSIGRYDFPTSSHMKTKETMEKIKQFDFDAKVLPGHGEETTLKHEKMNNPFLKERS